MNLNFEKARTGNYGNDIDCDDDKECPVCGFTNPDTFFISKNGECIGCDYCINQVSFDDWEDE